MAGDWSEQGGGQWSESDENVKLYIQKIRKLVQFLPCMKHCPPVKFPCHFEFSLEGFGHEGFALVALDDSAEGNAAGNTIASGGGCLGYGDHLNVVQKETHLFWDGWLSLIPMSMLGIRQKEIMLALFLQGQQDSHIFWTDIEGIQDNGWHEVMFQFWTDISNRIGWCSSPRRDFDGQPRCHIGRMDEFSRIYWIYRFWFCRNATGC